MTTCDAIWSLDNSAPSGDYRVDPDGPLVGDDPITVHCDMVTKKNGNNSVKSSSVSYRLMAALCRRRERRWCTTTPTLTSRSPTATDPSTTEPAIVKFWL